MWASFFTIMFRQIAERAVTGSNTADSLHGNRVSRIGSAHRALSSGGCGFIGHAVRRTLRRVKVDHPRRFRWCRRDDSTAYLLGFGLEQAPLD